MKKMRPPRLAHLDPHTPDVGLFKVRSKHTPRLKAEEFTTKELNESGLVIKYVTPYPLSDVDMRVFIAAMGLCTKSPHAINSEALKDQKTLWDKFLTEGDAVHRDAATIQTTAYHLATSAGLEWSGNVPKTLSECLERLSSVQTTWRQGSKVMSGSQMLSYAFDEDSGELKIAISPLLAKAILGSAGRHTRFSLDEMRKLTQPASRILHLILTGRLGVGGKRKKRDFTFHVDGLAVAAYGHPTSPAMKRKRRMYVRDALDELDSLDHWLITFDSKKELVHVTHWDDKNIQDLQINEERLDKIQRQLEGLDSPDPVED